MCVSVRGVGVCGVFRYILKEKDRSTGKLRKGKIYINKITKEISIIVYIDRISFR